jgi:hypothetical protein
VSAGNGRPEAVDAVPAPWPVDQAVLAAAAAEGLGVISVSRSARGFRDILLTVEVEPGAVTRLYCEPGASSRGGARLVLDAPGEYIRLTQLIG